MLSSGCDTAIEVMNTEQLWLPTPVNGGGGVHGRALPAELLATEEFGGVGGWIALYMGPLSNLLGTVV